MAQRRMFSKTITNSSQFLMMPQSSQNLYFHLGMNADDDWFCEHFAIMRMTDSKPDDLKILQAKWFVNIFDDKVLVILQRKENNYIQKDRYTESKYLKIYKDELQKLWCIQDVYKMETQVRLGKDSIEYIIEEKKEPNKDKKQKPIPIYIKTKQDIKDLFTDEPTFIEQNQIQLYILYRMIELWYKLISTKQKIKEDIEWLVNMISDYIPRTQDGYLNWNKARILTDWRFDYWNWMPKKPKNFKSSLRNSFNIFSK